LNNSQRILFLRTGPRPPATLTDHGPCAQTLLPPLLPHAANHPQASRSGRCRLAAACQSGWGTLPISLPHSMTSYPPPPSSLHVAEVAIKSVGHRHHPLFSIVPLFFSQGAHVTPFATPPPLPLVRAAVRSHRRYHCQLHGELHLSRPTFHHTSHPLADFVLQEHLPIISSCRLHHIARERHCPEALLHLTAFGSLR
jgi:hypothetical protein